MQHISNLGRSARGASLPAPKSKTPPHPRVRRRPLFSKGADQAKRSVRLRLRIAPPTRPKPPSIIAQLAGSGAGEEAP